MTTYFKAVQPDGTDFRTGTIDYLAGGVIRHPDVPAEVDIVTQNDPAPRSPHFDNASHYISVCTSPTDCTGFSWPGRLLEVETVGPVWTPHASDMPHKRACLGLRVVRELDPIELFGVGGAQVQGIIDRAGTLTYDEGRRLAAAWAAAWAAARAAARDAAWAAARAALTRDLIGTAGYTQEHYDLLSGPWRRIIGPIHPDDADLKGDQS